MKKAAAAAVIIILIGMGAFIMYRLNVRPEIRNYQETTQEENAGATENPAKATPKAVAGLVPQTEKDEAVEEPVMAETLETEETDPEDQLTEEASAEEPSSEEEPSAEEPASIFSTDRAPGPDPTAQTIEESEDRTSFDKPDPFYIFEK